MGRLALIIEDNTELAYIYGAALEALEYQTESIEDGKKALQRLTEIVPDLIILDMNLPHVSGHYIYKKLRSDAQFAHTPIIIATANQLIADALRAEIGGIDRLLVKPVSPSQLRAIAKEILEQTSSN
jgi:CheY-like chemotaxis protein